VVKNFEVSKVTNEEIVPVRGVLKAEKLTDVGTIDVTVS
jgi:hypothetical protein